MFCGDGGGRGQGDHLTQCLAFFPLTQEGPDILGSWSFNACLPVLCVWKPEGDVQHLLPLSPPSSSSSIFFVAFLPVPSLKSGSLSELGAH